jgi:hypothetical protein
MTEPPTLAEIRQALVDTVKANIASEVYAYKNIPDATQTPAIISRPLSSKYVVNMGEDATYEFQLVVLVSRNDTDRGQTELDKFVSHFGPDSISHAINHNSDLGLGDAVTALCYAMDGYGGSYDTNKVPHIGAILKVRVEADP